MIKGHLLSKHHKYHPAVPTTCHNPHGLPSGVRSTGLLHCSTIPGQPCASLRLRLQRKPNTHRPRNTPITPFHLKIPRVGRSPAARWGADTGLAGSVPPRALGIAGGRGAAQLTGLKAKPLWELFPYVAVWICRFNRLNLAN